ncbi:hypothetical protein G6F46_001729 [Rhizopus delemar]|uniref:UPF3 domain-containing protein n=2 Tax=Rhizopus TaxID=4842 RepID=A0A9P6ZBC9_9FUNG|nr:hypothetical protein G6F43_002317 [Rhizopus delemar]KAG1547132.1 hypothetical protein G6F51_004453 [Rhizopus arrhizus]KAG1459012.1 hypothetical protein G6F55_005010 [Rhizopus delemar]KAG1500575.1 hypothetical protein G6F54_003626 [Rhizopus delemar]KAG1515041.1 hypothetical protein G6F53_003220 [Rhizopus delemar]
MATQQVMDAPKVKPEEKKKRTKKKPRRQRKPTLKTKVVVRRLPPLLSKDEFMEAVKTWINEETTDYSSYIPGKVAKSKGKENVFSRAYFHFKTMEAVIAFHRGFDEHVFTDSRGNESRAVVEFSPYQKTPREHKSKDSREGTIDEDPEYLDFLKRLEAEKNKTAETQDDGKDGLNPIEKLENRIAMVTAKTLAAEQANKPKTTPLLEHLRAQKAAQAAAKAKKAAKKNARRKNENRSEQTASSSSESKNNTGNNGNNSNNNKPRKDRNKKKKEAKPSSDPSTKKERPPKKEGSNKPKRTKKPEQPQVMKIMTRQSPQQTNTSG